MVGITVEERLRKRLSLRDMPRHFFGRRLGGERERFNDFRAPGLDDVSINLRRLGVIGRAIKKVGFMNCA